MKENKIGNPTEGRRIHGLAETAREEGRFLDALHYTDEALLAYQLAGDRLGQSEVLSSRSITFRRLHRETNDRSFLLLAKHTSMAAVDIARESDERSALAVPLFQLENVQEGRW